MHRFVYLLLSKYSSYYIVLFKVIFLPSFFNPSKNTLFLTYLTDVVLQAPGEPKQVRYPGLLSPGPLLFLLPHPYSH